MGTSDQAEREESKRRTREHWQGVNRGKKVAKLVRAMRRHGVLYTQAAQMGPEEWDDWALVANVNTPSIHCRARVVEVLTPEHLRRSPP